MQDPTFEVVTMSPQWAEKILSHNNNRNRKIRKQHLLKLTRTIENGEWKITNQGIALDADGNLLDGQHRLAAIVKSKRQVKILLGRNCDPSTFGVIDIGATRTAGDMLTLSGCKSDHNTLAAAIKMYIAYIENPKTRWGSANTPNHNKVVKYWGAKEEIIGTYYPLIHKCHRHFKCFSKSAAITFCLIADDYEWRLAEVMEFWTLLSTGANLPADCAILSFRNQLTDPNFRRRGNGSHSAQLQLNAMIKCFNNWKEGKAVKRFISPTTPPMLNILPRDEVIGTDILKIIKKS